MEEIRKLINKEFALKLAAVLLPLLFFSYLMGVTMKLHLNDPDLWWHLKTGEYIVENWEIPDADPFAYTSPRPLSAGQKEGLRSQWLGQVIYHLAYAAGGLPGVAILRNLLVLLPPLMVYLWLARRRAGLLPSLAVASLPGVFFAIHLFYSFERPQGFSFSLALVVVMLLEWIKARSREPRKDFAYLLLPAVMALWSNIHPGFIVGNVIIIIYASSEAFLWAWRKIRRSETQGASPVFFAVCLAGVLGSFLNPNTYKLFYAYFTGIFGMFITDITNPITRSGGGSWVRDVVLEYKPLVYFYRKLGYDWLIVYWIFTVFLYVFLLLKYLLRRSFDLAEFLTVTMLVMFANMYARGLMFSLAVMPFFMAKTVVETMQDGKALRRLSRSAVAAMLVLSVAFCAHAYRRTPMLLSTGIAKSWISPWYPTLAAKFLKQNPVKPPMYNYYTWGGFLIWSLYPDYSVFIDGRALENWANRTADAILKAYPGWRSNLDAYRINFIVIPPVFRESGHVIPLAVGLAKDDLWELVFLRNNSAVFVRNHPRNAHLIEKYRIDKKNIFREIINVENLFLYGSPNKDVFNLAKANALMSLGRYAEAKAIFERFPSQSAHQLKSLKEMGY